MVSQAEYIRRRKAGETPEQILSGGSLTLAQAIRNDVQKLANAQTSLVGALAPSFKLAGSQLAAPTVGKYQTEAQKNLKVLGDRLGEALKNPNLTPERKKALVDLFKQADKNFYSEVPEVAPSKKQLTGAAIATASTFYPYGTVAKGVTQGLRGLGMSKGVSAIGKIGSGALGGFGYDIGENLMQESSPLKPGLGTVFGAALPAVGVGFGVLGRGAQKYGPTVLEKTTDIGKDAFKVSLERSKAVTEKIKSGATLETARNTGQDAVRSFRNTLSGEWAKSVKNIVDEFTGVRISIPSNLRNNLVKVVDDFPDLRLPQNFNSVSAKEVIDLLTTVNAVPEKFLTFAPKGAVLRSVKEELKKIAIDSFGGKGGSFATLYNQYSIRKGILDTADDVLKAYRTKKPLVQGAVLSRLRNIFNESRADSLKAIIELEKATGKDILSDIAAALLSKRAPINKALGRVGLGPSALVEMVVDIALIPFSSPRMANWLLQRAVKFHAPRVNLPGDKFLGTRSGQAVKEYIRNPKIGLSIEDVSKKQGGEVFGGFDDLSTKLREKLKGRTTVSKQFIEDLINSPDLKQAERDLIRRVLNEDADPLLTEARKYKSAEEFVNAQPTYYHATTKGAARSIESGGFKPMLGERSQWGINGLTKGRGVWLYPGDGEYAGRGAAESFVNNFLIREGKSGMVLETGVLGKIKKLTGNTDVQKLAGDAGFIRSLRKEGYVGMTGMELGQPQTFIFEPNALKTKSQLTDIWKYARRKKK